MANHFDGAFEFGLDGDIDAMREKRRDVFLVSGAGDGGESGVQMPGVFNGEMDKGLTGKCDQ